MAEVPKIVRARLAVKADAGTHPDADLLTGFAEHNLSQRERDRVLAHLSRCTECREVVILAVPQMETIVPQPSSSTRWLAWPVLRWGALAVCGVIVVAAVSLRQHPNEVKPTAARQESATAAPQPNEMPEEKASLAAGTGKDQDALSSPSRAEAGKSAEAGFVAFKPQANGTLVARAKAVPAPAEPAAAANLPVLADAKRAPNQPADKVSSGASLDAAVAQGSTEAANLSAPTQALQNEAARASLGKAKEAQELSSNAFAKSSLAKQQAMAAAAPMAVNQLSSKKLIPRWTLSADGTLQRSLDAGKTWKTIPVSADATFTVVAAMDSNIWVGGTHGALYHSVDAGEHWVQVVPVNNSQPLTSNIIGIEFTDAMHGKILTSSQESWTTSDGGQSWQVSR